MINLHERMLQSDLGPHCLPLCLYRFEKFARIFSRRHKQTTFLDAGFIGVLRVEICCGQAHYCNQSVVSAGGLGIRRPNDK